MKQTFINYYQAYHKKQIVLALLTGLIFALFIMTPILALIINLFLLFLYRIYFFSFLLILGAASFFGFWVYFTHKTLAQYHGHKKELSRKVLVTEMSLFMGLILVIGIILMIMLVPMYR